MLKADAKSANRSHHVCKSSIPTTDLIDSLDQALPGQAPYHHEGPFDATLVSRNMNPKVSPVAALAESNAAALQATDPEKIRMAIESHRPLEGVAEVPPGEVDRKGRRYDYVESNLMTEEGGNLGKIVNVGHVDPEIEEKLLAEKNRGFYEVGAAGPVKGDASGIELEDRPKNKKSVEISEQTVLDLDEHEHHHNKRHSLGEGIKRRIGSLRRKKD